MVAPLVKGIDGDWLASLARQSVYSEINPKKPNDPPSRGGGGKGGILRGGGAAGTNVTSVKDNVRVSPECGATTTAGTPSSLTKAQRIELRDKKRIQREERKRHAEEARMQRLAGKKRRNTKHQIDSIVASGHTNKSMKSGGKSETPSRLGREKEGVGGGKKRARMTLISERALMRLSASLESTISRKCDPSTRLPRHHSSIHKDDNKRLINGLPVEPSGKATRRSTIRPDSREMQPRPRDYNGQGLVRPSMYIPFDDPGFEPKLVMEFEEHIPGFFGKAKKKSAKKQADKDMLWRRCLRAREEEGGGGGGR